MGRGRRGQGDFDLKAEEARQCEEREEEPIHWEAGLSGLLSCHIGGVQEGFTGSVDKKRMILSGSAWGSEQGNTAANQRADESLTFYHSCP